jgi:hypothetical protein
MKTLAIAGLLALLSPAAAAGAPSIGNGHLVPDAWSNSQSGGALWVQSDFDGGLPGPAILQVNTASDGSSAGTWIDEAAIPGPLLSGANGIAGIRLAMFEGQHRVRVVIDGVANSPLELGTLQLDRTPPVASSVSLTPEGGMVVADWIQSDALSGTDPASPIVVEVNASPAGDAVGDWVAFAQAPDPGDGRKVARTDLGPLPDGRHLVRARTRDRAGNAGVHALGTVVSDHTPPVVDEVRVVRAAGTSGVAELAYRARDAGVGLAPSAPAAGPPERADLDWATPGASAAGRVLVRLPGPGVHLVSVRIADRVGNRGASAPVAVRVPTPAEAADAAVRPLPRIGGGGAAPGADVAWAYAQVRRLHATRGLRLTARLRVATTPAAWRRLIGAPAAARFTGYTTLDGRLLLGPAATRGLAALRRGRVAPGALSRAQLDRSVLGLAVLLHESMHATGPLARADIAGTNSGRALEEGVTEAATRDLLPRLIARLDAPAPLRRALGAAAARYRGAYPREVAWVRGLSTQATHRPAGSARARAWRIGVADTWGAGRWARLAAAVGRSEEALRAEAIRRR